MISEKKTNLWPRGWFAVAREDQIEDHALLSLHFLDRHFVAWKDKNKDIFIMDAITSSGIHLAHASIENDCVRCAVRGKLYDTSGKCIQAPCDNAILKDDDLKIWTSKVVDGLLYLWHDPENGEPNYTIPHRPEYDSTEWIPWNMEHFTLATHPREVVDNIADKAHFPVVHQAEVSSWETSFEGHKARQLQEESYVASDAIYHGPSHLITHLTPPGFDTYMLICHTPITDNLLGVWFGMMCYKGQKPLSDKKKMIIDGLIDMYKEGFFQDVVIWQHKKAPFDKPILCQGDGAIMESRSWYEQFYRPRATS